MLGGCIVRICWYAVHIYMCVNTHAYTYIYIYTCGHTCTNCTDYHTCPHSVCNFHVCLADSHYWSLEYPDEEGLIHKNTLNLSKEPYRAYSFIKWYQAPWADSTFLWFQDWATSGHPREAGAPLLFWLS